MIGFINIQKVLEQFVYTPDSPLIFTSGLFLFLFSVFLIFYTLLRRKMTSRIIYVLLFSLYFYYKTSGIYVLLLLFISVSDFIIGFYLDRQQVPLRRKLLVALSVSINLGILCYFKYTNFLLELFSDLVNKPFELQNIFLPIGISFFTFQSMSYIIDIYRRRIKPVDLWIDYVFYISFFPQLVAGPIVRAHDFIPQIYRKSTLVSREMFCEGYILIMFGLFKKAIVSDYISLNFVDRIFDNPLLYSGLENLIGVYGYALQIYCDFSGYSDMAIGIALLLGFRFNKNFDSPYKSATITEFWRRWHISLSSWLKDYLYVSMGGNRKGSLRTYVNLMVTMLLGGLWHGAALKFVIWGGLHGFALGVHKAVMSLFPSFKPQGMDMTSRWRRALGIFITFNFVCFTWIFFRASSMAVVGQVLTQIFTAFNPGLFFEFIRGYKMVTLLILVGYLLHFLPEKWENAVIRSSDRIPLPVKALAMTILIWGVMQMKSSDIQPFIYFQF